LAFDAEVEVLTEFTSDPDDPKATAKACFTAAIVYACFLGFCGCQVTNFIILSLEEENANF
jgi:ribonuclease kappa